MTPSVRFSLIVNRNDDPPYAEEDTFIRSESMSFTGVMMPYVQASTIGTNSNTK